MAVYTFDPSSKSLGTNPSGLVTAPWEAPQSYEIVDRTSPSYRVLRVTSKDSVRQSLSLDGTGADANADTVEVYLELVYEGQSFRTLMRASGSAGNETGLSSGRDGQTESQGAVIVYENGGITPDVGGSWTPPSTGELVSVLTVASAGSVDVYIWRTQQENQPGTPTFSQSVSVTGAGYAGFNTFVADADITWLSAGTNGDSAERSSNGTITPSISLSQSGTDAVVTWTLAGTSYAIERELYKSHLTKPADTNASVNADSHGIDRICKRDAARNQTYTYAFDGSGVRIYVVDTGVRGTHDEFTGRMLSGVDTYSGDSQDDPTIDNNGHGTETAGIAAGSAVGVAPGASVVPIRFRDQSGGLINVTDFVDALNWIRDNHPIGERGVVVVAATLPDDGTQDADTVDAAGQELIDRGIVIAHSAGNAGENSNRAWNRKPNILSVGMFDATDTVPSSSNHGPNVQVYAPTEVYTATNGSDTAYVITGTGTSSAAPHVAGVCALYLEANPYSAVEEVIDFIVRNATQGQLTQIHPESNARMLYSLLWSNKNTEEGVIESPYTDKTVFSGQLLRYKVLSESETDETDYAEIDLTGSQSLSGTVTIGGTAVESAKVDVIDVHSSKRVQTVWTDATGGYALDLPVGTYRIQWTYYDTAGDFGAADTKYGKATPEFEVTAP